MFSNQSQAASCINRTSCQGKPLWPFNFGNLVDRCSGLLSISQCLGSNICVSFFGALHQVVFAEEDHPLLVCNIAHLIVRGSCVTFAVRPILDEAFAVEGANLERR